MKVVHIQARLKGEFELPKEYIEKLPNKMAIFTTIQLMNSLPNIVKQLQEANKKPLVFKTGHTRNKGQILGCNVQNFEDYAKEDFDAFLYIGDGFFHPQALVWKNEGIPVHVYNPFTGKDYILGGKDIEMIKKRYYASLSKFYYSKNVGVLITTKPGQMLIKRAQELKEEYPDKNFYFFIENTLDFGMLEEFPFIDVFVNSMCPRVPFEDQVNISKPVVNLEDVKKKDPHRALVHEKGKYNKEI